jgi:serine/threonine protein kinase
MHTQHNYTDEQLIEMIDSDEPAERFEDLLRHIESCEQCQQRLDQLAATEEDWGRATRVLSGFSSSDAFRSQLSIGEPTKRLEDHCVAWTESMARQLLSPASHPEMMGRIGRYEVERLIGSGGMGIVFKAIDTELNRPVAIKILAPYLAGSGPARQRFAREARAAAAVVHEHVVPIHNVETDGQSPYLVMRYVAGESLQARIDRQGSLEVCEILRIANQVASGLSAAHSHGLVHRDIKPSNILVESGVDRSLITDFGLARAADDASLTNTGYHPGTPQYMSPEQAVGDAIDARSDLFSLGSVMFTMCTGRPPFRAETSYGILRRITDTQPRNIQESNPLVPTWLCGIIDKLMAKDRADRFQNAQEVAHLLELCLAHLQHPTAHPLPPEAAQFAKGSSFTSKKFLPKIGIAVAVIAAIAVGWTIWSQEDNAKQGSPVGDASNGPTTASAQDPDNENRLGTSQKKNRAPIVQPARKPPPTDPSDLIREQLSKKIDVQIDGLGFKEAVAAVLDAASVQYRIQDERFSDESIDVSKPCHLKSGSGTAGSLLMRVCEMYEASYIVRQTAIEIVPTNFAQNNPVLRYYDLAYVQPDSTQANAIIGGIQGLIEPDRWAASGGAFSISLVDSVLVVSASETAHLQIERLLAQLVLNSRSSVSK